MKSSTVRDPVCGMEVDPQNAAANAVRNGETFYFCSRHCRDEFLSPSSSNRAEGVESDTPGSCPKCGMALERNPTFREPAKIIYTCPMHPQIEQDHPGNCPICGMTLEPKNVVGGSEEENAELHDMTRRFWIGAVLSAAGVRRSRCGTLFPDAPQWVQGDVVALGAIHPEHAGGALVRMAVLPARLAIAG